jgi:hypothetical protein
MTGIAGSRSWRLRIWWWGVIAALLCAALFTWGAYEHEQFQNSPVVLFFVQTFAGNWSPPKPDGLWSGWFVGSAAIALALNLGAFAALMKNLFSLARLERKQLMNTSRLFYLRDAVIKDELYKIIESKFKLPEDKLAALHDDVEKAYEAGNSAWANSTLPDVLGKRGARDFLENVTEEMRPAAG